jgi:hypothetical protein
MFPIYATHGESFHHQRVVTNPIRNAALVPYFFRRSDLALAKVLF